MTKKMEWWEYPVPQVFPQTYLMVAQQRGADSSELLKKAGIPHTYSQHPFDISTLQMHNLSLAVLETVGDDGLGLDIGWHLPPTAFGSFGYALLCSANMADVLDLIRRYWHLVGRGTQLSIHDQDELLVGELILQVPFPEPLQRLACEVTFSSLYRGFSLLTGLHVTGVDIWFAFPEPSHASRIRECLGDVQFDMPANQFRAPKQLLNVNLGMHNPTGLKFALEQCERENALIDTHATQSVAHVRELLILTEKGFPTLEQVSKALNMTTRTLRRRLQQEGTSFKKLSDEAKRRDALKLLDNQRIDIQRVAEQLGYQDPANFTRAFKQWTGQTPSQYRETRKV